MRQEPVDEGVERDAGVEGDLRALRVDRDAGREAGGVEDDAAGVLGRVSVGAAEPAGDGAASVRTEERLPDGVAGPGLRDDRRA